MSRFEGKLVIVTSAASGFWAAIAVRFTLKGASVLCADLSLASEEAGFVTGTALDIGAVARFNHAGSVDNMAETNKDY